MTEEERLAVEADKGTEPEVPKTGDSPHEQQEGQAAVEAPEEEAVESDGSLVDDDGKYLGAFENPIELAKAHKDLTRKSTQVVEDARKHLEPLGYKFDEATQTFTPPVEAKEETPENKPEPFVPPVQRYAKQYKRDAGGFFLVLSGQTGEAVPHELVGETLIPAVSEADWEAFEEEYGAVRTIEAKQRLESQKQDARTGFVGKLKTGHETERQSVNTALAAPEIAQDVPQNIIEAAVKEAEQVLALIPEETRYLPGYYEQAVNMALAPRLVNALPEIIAAAKTRGSQTKKVIAVEGGSAAAPASVSAVKLTAEEAKVAKAFGMTPTEYVKSRDNS